ncbi:hypothetical protein ABIB38_000626 [Massilia sp. UYP11]|uniref:hypothetical protein n=1 Tax=Massilia sp. UYP11 TaxID=1756385 RepID=UPI003D1A1D9F
MDMRGSYGEKAIIAQTGYLACTTMFGAGHSDVRGVGGFAADAVIVIGSDFVPDDLAANHHRVGGKPPTQQNKTRQASRGGFFRCATEAARSAGITRQRFQQLLRRVGSRW